MLLFLCLLPFHFLYAVPSGLSSSPILSARVVPLTLQLSAMNFFDLLVRDLDEYVDLAVRLGQNPRRLAETKMKASVRFLPLLLLSYITISFLALFSSLHLPFTLLVSSSRSSCLPPFRSFLLFSGILH